MHYVQTVQVMICQQTHQNHCFLGILEATANVKLIRNKPVQNLETMSKLLYEIVY